MATKYFGYSDIPDGGTARDRLNPEQALLRKEARGGHVAGQDFVAAIIFDPKTAEIVLVRDLQKEDPKDKLPGGHMHAYESPELAASREVAQECGVRVPPESWEILRRTHRRDHWFNLVAARSSGFPGHKETGNLTGEISRIAAIEGVLNDPEVLPSHRQLIEEFVDRL